MRIAVVDDERPARSELGHQLKEILPEVVIEEGDSGAAALELAEGEKFDLFFLDINLGDISGTALVAAIKRMQPDTKVIFVTAYSEYAVTAFELGVEDYVMKPFDGKRIKKVLERMGFAGEAAKADEKLSGKRLAITSGGKTIFEDIDKIVYIETYSRGCLIHVDGVDHYEGKSIGELEKRLDGKHFFRCHKSYLINLEKVRELFPWGNNSLGLKMQGYEENILPVGREKTKILRQLLG